MMQRHELGFVSHLGEGLLHLVFELLGEMDVLNLTASDTNQVMVMPEQWLGQFKMCVVAGGPDAMDDAAAFQHVQAAVGRAGRQAR